MALLTGLRVARLGPGLAAAVCGRLFADMGAMVCGAGGDDESALARFLNADQPAADGLADADLILCQGGPDLPAIRAVNASAPVVLISDYGQGIDDPATDLTLLYASGIARLLTGQVDDLSEAPIRPVGEQSAFIGGVAAACAGMHAVLAPEPGAVIDVSLRDALATLAMTELTRAGQTGRGWSRKRLTDGNGATVCILPASDGYAAISPREDKQWEAWLEAMGNPAWGREPRFATKADRVANWDALHALMSGWSRQHPKQWIADTAQKAHVPSFPLLELPEHFGSAQLAHRGFWRDPGDGTRMPGSPFGETLTPGSGKPSRRGTGPLPLAGVRVLDFSWVIAGPTATRYLAAMGAEVIKVEAPGRGDPGRASELHTVLGQAKKAIVLDLKKPEDRAAARALAASSDVLVENFATGVMDRLGLGAEDLRAVNPDLIYVSASGMGRTGPMAHAVAYGTLLQCFSGFAGLNRHPDVPPRVGFAWLDPMLGLMLAFAAAASLWRRGRDGAVARVDCSMIEAILWTLAAPLLAVQTGTPLVPMGNRSDDHRLHGAWRCAGDDAWVAIAARTGAEWDALRGLVPGLTGEASDDDAILTAWCRDRDAWATADALMAAGVPASALESAASLLRDPRLLARGFWETFGDGVLPSLPWRASFGRAMGPAPALGADTAAVLRDLKQGVSP